MPRTHLPLTGSDQRWFFAPDALGEGLTLGWHQPDAAQLPWREVRLPAAASDLIPGATWYEGAAWFRHTLFAPEHWRGRHIALRFEGANYHCNAWLNGVHIAGSRDGFLRITGPIDHALRFGADNIVAVRIDTTRRAGDVPGLERGWRPYGGILREVYIDICNLLHIAEVHFRGDMHGAWHSRVTIANRTPSDATLAAVLELTHDGADAGWESSDELVVPAGSTRTIDLAGTVPNVRHWSPATPALYQARLKLLHPSHAGVEDIVEERVGFRTLETRGSALLLNGEPLFLTGFNRHEDSPSQGMCPDLKQTRADIIDMKTMGANFVRLCHYPHHPAELDLCDEIGLLVMAEIPLYWWKSAPNAPNADTLFAKTRESAQRQLSRMIARDYNHPSIAFWSVSNENHEQHVDIQAGNRDLIAYARQLDPERLIVHVSDHWHQHPNFDADDVICVNWYPSYWGGGRLSDPHYAFTRSAARWADALAQLHARYPDKPILVTEFGYGALAGITQNALGEDAQAAVIDAEFAGITGHPFVCGATVWCYADHPWPEENFLAYLNTSPFGVVTRTRRKKQAYWHLRKLFRAAQHIADAPAPAAFKITDDMPITMTRPNLENIPDVPFPPGYGIRPMQRGEGPIWADIQRDAEDRIPISDGLFDSQFGMDEPAQTWRCFFITGPRGAAVGTISAWYDPDPFGQPAGRIHWVAVRHANRRKGLARAGLAHALHQMRQWHDRAFLDTSTSRLGAIHLYLDFGFVPYMRRLGAAEAWATVAKVLPHPALHVIGAH